jgi:hypothetical protein
VPPRPPTFDGVMSNHKDTLSVRLKLVTFDMVVRNISKELE